MPYATVRGRRVRVPQVTRIIPLLLSIVWVGVAVYWTFFGALIGPQYPGFSQRECVLNGSVTEQSCPRRSQSMATNCTVGTWRFMASNVTVYSGSLRHPRQSNLTGYDNVRGAYTYSSRAAAKAAAQNAGIVPGRPVVCWQQGDAPYVVLIDRGFSSSPTVGGIVTLAIGVLLLILSVLYCMGLECVMWQVLLQVLTCGRYNSLARRQRQTLWEHAHEYGTGQDGWLGGIFRARAGGLLPSEIQQVLRSSEITLEELEAYKKRVEEASMASAPMEAVERDETDVDGMPSTSDARSPSVDVVGANASLRMSASRETECQKGVMGANASPRVSASRETEPQHAAEEATVANVAHAKVPEPGVSTETPSDPSSAAAAAATAGNPDVDVAGLPIMRGDLADCGICLDMLVAPIAPEDAQWEGDEVLESQITARRPVGAAGASQVTRWVHTAQRRSRGRNAAGASRRRTGRPPTVWSRLRRAFPPSRRGSPAAAPSMLGTDGNDVETGTPSPGNEQLEAPPPPPGTAAAAAAPPASPPPSSGDTPVDAVSADPPGPRRLVRLQCGHVFHFSCMKHFLCTGGLTCPLCNRNLPHDYLAPRRACQPPASGAPTEGPSEAGGAPGPPAAPDIAEQTGSERPGTPGVSAPARHAHSSMRRHARSFLTRLWNDRAIRAPRRPPPVATVADPAPPDIERPADMPTPERNYGMISVPQPPPAMRREA